MSVIALRPLAPLIPGLFALMLYVPGARAENECATCHPQIASAYKQTGMARSLYRPAPENRAEDFKNQNTLYHAASDRYYAMTERDGKLFERRHQIGFDGKETNVVEEQIDYVIGSGNHARTYVHRGAAGKLLEMPVSWYSEKGGYWAMSPGYDRPGHEDFRRPVADDCLFCHNAYPSTAQKVPEGIDCERCHGSGRAHMDAVARHAAPEAIRAAIVNPAKLSRDRQLDVCMQCHLETTSLPLPGMIRRYDREPFSYRPGQALGDYALYFDHRVGAGYDDRFEVAHAAYRLRQSACFLKSQMTCTTCHDPHRVQAAAHYVEVCRTCHAAAHAGTARSAEDCLGCHMPKRRTDDVVHVVMTDHFIERNKPARDPAAPLNEEVKEYRGQVVAYYPSPVSDLYLAVAQTAQGSNLEAGTTRLQQAIAKDKPQQPEFYLELGSALVKQGKNKEAIPWFTEALRRRPGFEPASVKLAAAYAATGQLARAESVGERAGLANLGNIYLQEKKYDQARQVLARALKADPDLPEAHQLLGLIWLQKGDRAAGEKEFREAIRLQPDLAEAHNNLASLLAESKDYSQAEYHFRKAIAANPGYAEAHHSYGFLLTLMQKWDQILSEFETAARLDDRSAQIHSDYADVLAATGNTALAEKEYRRAIELDPNRLEAHLSLATILVRNGNAAEARQHFQLAAKSSDPEIRDAALKALQ